MTGPVRRRIRERYQRQHHLTPPGDLTSEAIDVGGVTRQYWCAPAPPGAVAPPLLLVLHGAGGQGPGTAALSGLHRRGPEAGFLTVFPDGVRRVWNDSRTGGATKRRARIDDVGFLEAMVARFASTGRARAEGVYLAGISNGALMSEHVGRHALLDVAGLGLVAGPGTETSRAAQALPARPAAVVLFSGTADPLIPYGGGPIGPLGRMVQRRGDTDRGLAVAAEVAAAEWAAAGHLPGPPVVEPIPTAPGDLAVTRLQWSSPGTATVALYRVSGGGHTWPGGAQYLPERFVGPVARSLDATGIMLEAFVSEERRRRTSA